MKIGFIGVGKLGKDVAEVMAEKHFVEGYDINPNIKPSNFNMVNDLESVCEDKDIIFIAVPTPHDPLYDGSTPTSHLQPKDFDYYTVQEILFRLNEYVSENQLVVLISTVLPGTVRKNLYPAVFGYRFIYNPYLIAMGTVKEDFINPEMVIIGTKDGYLNSDANELVEFYQTLINPNTRYEIGTWDEAESIKIFYNTFISAKVSLVNMIQDVAERNGNINTDVVTGALERSTYRITGPAYMKAGMGDGGSCHPRDNIALRYMAKELDLGYDLFDSIMKSREVQAINIARKLAKLSTDNDLPIIIMGESYKPGVPYVDGSYSLLIGHYLKNEFLKNVIYDDVELKGVYLLGHRGVFNNTVFPTGSIVLDPWRERINEDTVYYGGNKK
jgi:UDPglucose 6-dehydrogenase